MDKKKIFIVDDDESVLEYLQTALLIENYDVATAQTATEALGKLKSTAGGFPVVLSDIMMPGIDGLELLKIVRKEYPDTIVIMLTAHASLDTAVRALNMGAFGYLMKPVELDELRVLLKNAYEKHELVKENQQLVKILKDEKEYSESIVKNLVYTVVATDAGGNIRKVNKAMEDLLGYTEQELINKPIQSIFSAEFKQNSWNELVKQTHVENFPVVFHTKDGRDLKVFYSGTIMKDAQGKVVGFLGTTSV